MWRFGERVCLDHPGENVPSAACRHKCCVFRGRPTSSILRVVYFESPNVMCVDGRLWLTKREAIVIVIEELYLL